MDKNLLKDYINVHVSLSEEYYETVAALLQGFPFTGIEERDNEIIITFFSSDWNDEMRRNIMSRVNIMDKNAIISKEETIADRDWNEEWEKTVRPVVVSDDIVITPEWKKDDIHSKYKILINPKMSFGTGEHQTTRLVCRMMEKIKDPKKFWIDAGTGTGVLAIFAVMLGAKRVFAFDNNIWSVENAKENFALNGVSDKIELAELDIENCSLPECDIIVANIFLSLLLPSMPLFYKALREKRGELILSGILEEHLDDILNAAKANHFEILETATEGGWIAAHLKIESTGNE